MFFRSDLQFLFQSNAGAVAIFGNEYHASGFKRCADGLYCALSQFLATFKASDCVGRHFRQVGQVADADPQRHPRHFALNSQHFITLLRFHLTIGLSESIHNPVTKPEQGSSIMVDNIVDFNSPTANTGPHDFAPACEPFSYTNDEFAMENLPMVRAATFFCSRDFREVESNVRIMLTPENEGMVFMLLDDLKTVRDRMEAIVEYLREGERRVLVTLQRLAPEFDQ
jgi:hypothetical protein